MSSRIITAAVAGAALVAIACSSAPDEDTSQPPPAPAASTPAGYLDAVKKAAPDVPAKRAVSAAEDTCLDVKQGKDDATLTKNLAARLEVSEATAKKVLPAVRLYYCA